MARIRRRVAALLTAAVVSGSIVLTGAGTAAAAEPSVRFVGGSEAISIFVNGKFAGAAYWKANGDTLQATDSTADGYYVAAYLGTNPVREASTDGHASPYTATKTGNLPEGNKYNFWACVGKGSFFRCSPIWTATA
ncbi:hypothetical protein ACFW5I_09670 [Streptomyces sp. NPDC058818]|uniref:hypothetical protein n=1 Tax=Streptomyces sp. NPDC058818 TaxID=3346640 RepID=UPI0036C4A653